MIGSVSPYVLQGQAYISASQVGHMVPEKGGPFDPRPVPTPTDRCFVCYLRAGPSLVARSAREVGEKFHGQLTR